MVWILLACAWPLTLAAAFWVGRTLNRPVPVVSSTSEVACAPAPEVDPPPAKTIDQVWASLEAVIRFQKETGGLLADSIVRGLRATTDPMTSHLVEIRSETAAVVSLARTHDPKMETGEDLERMDALGARVHEDMAGVARLTQESHQAVDRHFLGLEKKLQTVLDLCGQIEDVSDRINVLSINASIEAARAGVAGRGFKVIAGEVKSLAQNTSDLSKQILSTIQSTQELFTVIGRDLGTKKVVVSEILNLQEIGFGEFFAQFRVQRSEFETLYRSILSFAELLDTKVQHLSPLVQLHDIVVQELENLALVHDDALTDLIGAVRAKSEDPNVELSALNLGHRATATRKRLTTAAELRNLDKALQSAGIDSVGIPDSTVPAVELF